MIVHHVSFIEGKQKRVLATGEVQLYDGFKPICSCGEKATRYYGRKRADLWVKRHAGACARIGAQGGLF